jgi:rod shape-determining protein MreD
MFALSMGLAILLGGVVQAVLPASPRIGQAPAPVLLAIVLFHALIHNRDASLVAAFAAGIVQDSLGWTPFGTSSFAFCAVAAYVSNARRQWLDVGVPAEAFVGAVAAALLTPVSYLLLLAREPDFLLPWRMVALKTVGAALLGAIVTPVVCGLLRRLDRALGTAPKQVGLRLETKS